jgi:phage terminase Nu1 subunit (DNA packaging protein)
MVPILETLPLAMKRAWPEITGDQIQLVKKAVAECRNEMAEAEIKF